MTGAETSFFDRVYALVRRIPRGRVASYGQVAALLGVPRGARAVGWALRGIGVRAESVPWHRVVGQHGRISLDGRPSGLVQRRRLRREGVCFTGGRVDMNRHGLRFQQQAASAARFTRAERSGYRKRPQQSVGIERAFDALKGGLGGETKHPPAHCRLTRGSRSRSRVR
jgi:methylated-DNA-protein-cysteine methyltransferase related protein